MTPEHLREIEELYNAARQDPGVLAHANTEVRLEVESLLAHEAVPLPSLTAAAMGRDETEHKFRRTDITAGTMVGPYRIESLRGAGGMGRVFRARDMRLGRTVAIKFVQAELANRSDFRRLFEGEAKAISALNHPHICSLHDIGEHEGNAWLVMEYVDGEALNALMKESLLALDDALRYGIEIADALAAAHALGIIHRDLKPGNIMVTAAGVKVLDFGVATRPAGEIAEASTLGRNPAATKGGPVVGTFAYMSPEQAQGKPVDARSDVFALGIVLYEMLCGRHPFRGDTTLMTLSALLQKTPDRPRTLRTGMPAALERIVLRCLEKEPDLRYSSAADLHRDLAAVQTSRKTGLQFTRRTATVTAIVILIAGAAFGLQSWQRARRMRRVEKTAVPEIARLIQEDRGLAAFKLFQQAEKYAPNSQSLFKLEEGVATRPVSFKTTPPGARIYISDYAAAAGDNLSDWQFLGEAPLTVKQIPNWGYYRVRAIKQGFAREDQTFGGGNVEITLQPEQAVPAGMVRIPARTSPASPAFWMDRYEVTNRQYKQFVDAGGYRNPAFWKHPFIKDGHPVSWQKAMNEFHDLTGRPGPAPWQLGSYPEGADDMPVGGVNWYEAEAYAEFGGKSLPTVDEWNQAAGISPNSDILQLSNFSGKSATPAGARRGMAPFGNYDMAGNLKEWTTNSSGTRRYILGGGWDESPYAFTIPDAREPFTRESTFGFRCVKRSTPSGEVYGPVSLSAFAVESTHSKPVDDELYRVFLHLHAYEKTALESRIERIDESSPYWRRETVSFRAAYGNERVIAHLFLPRKAVGRLQIVAVMGGSTIGGIKRIEDFDYPYEFLLRSGRAVVIPAYSGTLERGPSQFRLPANQERERALKWSMDLGRTIDYLETRRDIDTKRLGFYGISAGASHGVRLVAVEPRIKVAVFSSGGLQAHVPAETDAWNFAPRVRIPVLMVNGRNDFILPVETNQKPLFRALGTKETDKKYVLYDGGHRNLVTRPDLIGEIVDWFDKYLGTVQARP
jgi:serine/threonine protein kinase